MAETATKIPLFAGDSEIDQLFQIYRILGTPNPKTWPGIDELPDYHRMGPQWKKKDLAQELNGRLDADGIDLLQKTLIYAPNQRITAQQMLLHRWFDDIREEMKGIYGTGYPHCGSPEYQRRKRHIKDRVDESKDKNAECDVVRETDADEDDDDSDEEYIDEEGDTEEVDEEDTDLDEEDVDSDDDDDMIQNANQRSKSRRRGDEQGLSQPMDEDE